MTWEPATATWEATKAGYPGALKDVLDILELGGRVAIPLMTQRPSITQPERTPARAADRHLASCPHCDGTLSLSECLARYLREMTP